MPTALQLKEKRANIWAQMRSYLDTADAENRDLTAEERSGYDAAETELETLTSDIDRIERHANRSGSYDAAPTTGDPTPNHRTSEGDEAEEHRKAYMNLLRRGDKHLNAEARDTFARIEARAQASGTNSAGGYLVPPEYREDLIIRLKAYGAVRAVSTVITTSTGAPLQWPTMDDTSNVGAILAENTQISEQDIAVGTATLGAYKYTSKLTRASLEVIQDSAFDVQEWVQSAHAARLGRIQNQHFTTGTGSSQPTGIVTGATSGVTAAHVSNITADELIDLVHSLDPAYRSSPNVQFMLSDTALKALRKLKDSNGQYLWQPGIQDGVNASLFGYRYVINVDMAVPATGVKSVLFGDFKAGYVIRDVLGLQRIVFEERYMDYLQMAYASFLRTDATVQNANAYRALTQA